MKRAWRSDDGWGRAGNGWGRTLNPQQRATVKRIMAEHRTRKSSATEGFKVYMMPTTTEPTYLELRYYLTSGRITRWVIERDGSVSEVIRA